MPETTSNHLEIYVGVDTHKEQHVAVAITGLGASVDRPRSFAATQKGYEELLAWSSSLGSVPVYGVEGCGSYGCGLARYLRRHGLLVQEVARPVRKGERRRLGKDDAIDAEHAARTVLSGVGIAIPKLGTGQIEALRLIKIARDTAVKAQATAMVTLKAVLVTAPSSLRETLEGLSRVRLITSCAALQTCSDTTSPESAMRYTLQMLATRWIVLATEIRSHTSRLKKQTKAVAGELLATFGIGFDSAAELLITAGDNTDRIHSEAALAKLCGVCPIPAGSGRTNGRHRLNRGGNRQANASLYRIVIVRMRWHPPTIAYVERRRAQGLSKREIIRCLKRYVVREIYRKLPAPSSTGSDSN
jgi:transposase